MQSSIDVVLPQLKDIYMKALSSTNKKVLSIIKSTTTYETNEYELRQI